MGMKVGLFGSFVLTGAQGRNQRLRVRMLRVQQINDDLLLMIADRQLAVKKVKLPARDEVADTLLIFVAKPDDAEAILGDLIEQTAKVRARKSAFVTWIWFWWEVFWIVVKQLGARVRENTQLGRFLDACIGRISR